MPREPFPADDVTGEPDSPVEQLHEALSEGTRPATPDDDTHGLPPGSGLGSYGTFTLTLEVPTFQHFKPYSGTRVYHYTSSAGLIGLVTSGCLWASAARNLNDGSEMSYGLGLLSDVLADFVATQSPQTGATVRDVVERIVGDFDHARVLVVCASTVGDDLSQFRAYGDVAVELDAQVPLQLLDDPVPFPLFMQFESVGKPAWREVVYEPALQRDALTKLLEKITEDIERHGHEAEGVRSNDICFHTYTYWVAWSVSHIKNPAFEAEKEVRTVRLVTPDYRNFHFRATAVGVVPYVEMRPVLRHENPGGADMNLLPITGVHVGPVHYPETARYGIEQLLKMNWYGEEATVTASSIPYRA